jgi:hypothetical protein
MSQASQDRKVRIELLQARAAIERQSVVHGVHHLGASLTPRGLMESFFPRARGKSPSDLLLRAVSMSRRYPMLLSLGSALFSTSARRKLRWWKLAAGAFMAWQAARNLRK